MNGIYADSFTLCLKIIQVSLEPSYMNNSKTYRRPTETLLSQFLANVKCSSPYCPEQLEGGPFLHFDKWAYTCNDHSVNTQPQSKVVKGSQETSLYSVEFRLHHMNAGEIMLHMSHPLLASEISIDPFVLFSISHSTRREKADL